MRPDRLVRAAGLLAMLLGLGSSALGHDIPNELVERALQVEVTPRVLLLHYEVSLSELTAIQDLRRLGGELTGLERRALFERYGQMVGPLNQRGLVIRQGAAEREPQLDSFELEVLEHPRYVFHFRAEHAGHGPIEVIDRNYMSSQGTSRIAVRAAADVRLLGYTGPTDLAEVEARPVWMLSDEEERATHEVGFDFEVVGGAAQDDHADQPEPALAESGPLPASAVSLRSLLTQPPGWRQFLVWLLAILLGAGHSLQPGHGKTLIAAATVGSRGRLAGLAVALVATTTHLLSVVLIALGLWITRATEFASIHRALIGLTGLVIAAVGLYRLGRVLGGHVKPLSTQIASEAPASLERAGILTLGIMGGLIPCWDAVLLVMLAQLTGNLAWGLILLLGFSLGMLGVLATVAWTVERGRRWLENRTWIRSVEPGLSLVAGACLTGIGLYFWLTV